MLILFFTHVAKIFLIIWLLIVLVRAKFYLSFIGFGYREYSQPLSVGYFELMQELIFPSDNAVPTSDKEKERRVLNFLCKIYWLNTTFIIVSFGGLMFIRLWFHS